jgi:hypothetical protein
MGKLGNVSRNRRVCPPRFERGALQIQVRSAVVLTRRSIILKSIPSGAAQKSGKKRIQPLRGVIPVVYIRLIGREFYSQ